jgi:hypothetical protein
VFRKHLLNQASCDKYQGHIKINSRGNKVGGWMSTTLVDKVKKWMEPTPEKAPRGKPTPTNHTDLVTLALDHVEMG